MPYSLEKLEELSGGDQDFIVSVVVVFIEETPEDLGKLEKAVQAGDFEEVYKHAHKLKPNVDLLGMENSTALMRRIEAKAKEAIDIEAIRAMFAKAKTEVGDVIKELETDFGL